MLGLARKMKKGGRLELTPSMELRKENCNLYEEGPDQKLERSSEKLYALQCDQHEPSASQKVK